MKNACSEPIYLLHLKISKSYDIIFRENNYLWYLFLSINVFLLFFKIKFKIYANYYFLPRIFFLTFWFFLVGCFVFFFSLYSNQLSFENLLIIFTCVKLCLLCSLSSKVFYAGFTILESGYCLLALWNY